MIFPSGGSSSGGGSSSDRDNSGSTGKVETTTKPDGTTKTVSYDPKNPNSVDVKTTNPDGTSSELHQKGTEVSKSTTDARGKTIKDSYSLDSENNPVKESTGPGEDDGFFDALANGPVSATDPRALGGDLVDANAGRDQ